LQPPKLFTPIQLGGITLPNRVVISPMCQSPPCQTGLKFGVSFFGS